MVIFYSWYLFQCTTFFLAVFMQNNGSWMFVWSGFCGYIRYAVHLPLLVRGHLEANTFRLRPHCFCLTCLIQVHIFDYIYHIVTYRVAHDSIKYTENDIRQKNINNIVCTVMIIIYKYHSNIALMIGEDFDLLCNPEIDTLSMAGSCHNCQSADILNNIWIILVVAVYGNLNISNPKIYPISMSDHAPERKSNHSRLPMLPPHRNTNWANYWENSKLN